MLYIWNGETLVVPLNHILFMMDGDSIDILIQ